MDNHIDKQNLNIPELPAPDESAVEKPVMDAVRSGRVAMKPKWQFALRAILVAIAAFLVGAIAFYIASFIVFELHESGEWFAPAFGSRGWVEFFFAAPWLLIGFGVVAIIALGLILRRYAFSWRWPALYVLGAILVVIIGFTIVSQIIHLHEGIESYVEAHHVPFAEPLYRHPESGMSPNIYRGQVTTTTASGFLMQDRRGQSYTIIITPMTHVQDYGGFDPGDDVVVFGQRTNMTIQAHDVLEIPDPSTSFSPSVMPSIRPNMQ